jgi:hypothetical protein
MPGRLSILRPTEPFVQGFTPKRVIPEGSLRPHPRIPIENFPNGHRQVGEGERLV